MSFKKKKKAYAGKQDVFKTPTINRRTPSCYSAFDVEERASNCL